MFSLSSSRLSALLQAWRSSEDATASKCTALACVIGDVTASTYQNQRGQAVLQYILEAGAPVANLAAIISQETTLIVHDGKVSVNVSPINNHTVTVVSSRDGMGSAIMTALAGKTVGAALKEFSIQEGDFAGSFIAHVKESTGAQLAEVAPVLGELLFVKDVNALSCVEKAAGLCKAVFRRFARKEVEDEFFAPSPKTLHELREALCEKLEHPNTVEGLEALNVSEFSLATLLTPCIFHKGSYIADIQIEETALRQATSAATRGDVVVIRFGAKSGSYTAFMGRTLIIESNAPADAKDAYNFVYAVSDKVIDLLHSGSKVRDIYTQVMEFAQSTNAGLTNYLGKSFGFSTGLLVLEPRGSISEKGVATVTDGMSFVVRVCLEKIPNGVDGETYDIELADTVVIRDGAAQLHTKVARKLEDILYQQADDDECAGSAAAFTAQPRDLAKITRQGLSSTVILSREAQREAELGRILLQVRAEFDATGGKKLSLEPIEELYAYEVGKLSRGDLHPFGANEQIPPEGCRQKGIYVQPEKKIAWFPICGHYTPFHISTISKVDVKVEGESYSMSVTLHSLQESNVAYKLNRTKVFAKELSYRASQDIFTDAQVAIQGVMQRIKNEDADRKRKKISFGGDKLTITPNALRLPQVKMRPPIAAGRQNKGCVGNLELHQNGLRFSFLGGAPVDLLFDNIKHIIFQPSQHTICVIYHVTLKRPIELGRKSVSEIQFVAEVMESSEAATGVRRSYDEEVHAEERDEARINDTNKQFMRFAGAVEEKSGKSIKTQLPMRGFSFDGVHTRAVTTFKGSKEVLWAVSDWPAFTQRVDEVEVVFLERMLAGGSTIDVSLVPKDYTKPVSTINAIPSAHVDAVKDWCLAAGLYYVESSVNINWREIMKSISTDSEWNPWDTEEGWPLFNAEENEDDDSGSEASDSTYNEEEDEESTSDDDDSSWLEDDEEESEEESSSDNNDDDVSSAASWDELERRAVEQDRKRTFSDDDEHSKPRKRQRTTSAATSSPHVPTALPRAPSAKVPIQYGKSVVPPPRRF